MGLSSKQNKPRSSTWHPDYGLSPPPSQCISHHCSSWVLYLTLTQIISFTYYLRKLPKSKFLFLKGKAAVPSLNFREWTLVHPCKTTEQSHCCGTLIQPQLVVLSPQPNTELQFFTLLNHSFQPDSSFNTILPRLKMAKEIKDPT